MTRVNSVAVSLLFMSAVYLREQLKQTLIFTSRHKLHNPDGRWQVFDAVFPYSA